MPAEAFRAWSCRIEGRDDAIVEMTTTGVDRDRLARLTETLARFFTALQNETLAEVTNAKP